MTKPKKTPEPKGIPSLRAFVDSLESAEHEEYVARARSRVAHEDAFSEMKSHILGLYENVEAAHSFVDETGAIFDCIPIGQQPALRGSKEEVPEAPDLPPLEAEGAAETAAPRGRGEREDLSARCALSA